MGTTPNRPRTALRLVLACASLAFAGVTAPRTVHAVTRFAAPPPLGDDANDCLSPGTPCATIREAAARSSPGDAVMAAAGTYVETVVVGADIRVAGAGIGVTIVDGGGDGPVFTLGDQSHLERMTVTGGHSDTTTGGFIAAGGVLGGECVVLIDLLVEGNAIGDGLAPALAAAGGIALDFSGMLERVIVRANTAGNAVDADVAGGVAARFSLTLRDTIVEANVAGSSSVTAFARASGGACVVGGLAQLVAIDTKILRNVAGDGGSGGFSVIGGGAFAGLTRTVVDRNEAGDGLLGPLFGHDAAAGGGFVGGGGAILCGGEFSHNEAGAGIDSVDGDTGACGGAFVVGGGAKAYRVVAMENTAGKRSAGGLVVRGGGVSATECVASDNVSGDEGVGGLLVGGGGSSAVRCTSSGNRSGRAGTGGLTVLGGAAENCTVSGNEAGADGVGGASLPEMRSSTVARNIAGVGGIGGVWPPGIDHVILAANVGGAANDCLTVVSDGFNLVEDPGGCTITGLSGTDILGADPLLGPLADNGGPTATHALMSGSPAIDAGAPACLPTDQRGLPRPSGPACDIGAFEVCALPICTLVVSSCPGAGLWPISCMPIDTCDMDVNPPTLVGVPADAVVDCDAVPEPADVTAVDDCDPAPTVSFEERRIDGPCEDTYTLERRWTARDEAGNTSSATQRISVIDDEAPRLLGVPADQSASCDAIPDPRAVTAEDCDPAPIVTFDERRIDGPCPDTYTLERRWFARDRCGNTSSATQRLSVVDDKAPRLLGVPPDEAVPCDAVADPPAVTAEDDCDTAPIVSFDERRIDGPCQDTYTLERRWSARDRCGNTSSATQRLRVVDDEAPRLLDLPPDQTVVCDAVPDPAVVTAEDDCDTAPVVTFDERRIDGPCADTYTLERRWSARDRCGNTSSATQRLSVIDDRAPRLLDVPPDQTVACDAVPDPAVVTAEDDCDTAPTITFDERRIDGPCPDTYTLERRWSARDRCGNTSSATQRVSVVDDEAPRLLDVPPDQTVACDAVPDPAVVTAEDDCDTAPTVTFEERRIDGPCPDTYTLERRWTARDRCGNTSSATQRVSVVDSTPPIVEARLEPVDPLPPSPPRSACSPPASRIVRVACAARDACDPSPRVAARLVVVNHDLVAPGTYVERVEMIDVACGSIVEIRLVAPPCPKRPRNARGPHGARSDGVAVVTGERVTLEVTATDRCGNSAVAGVDPTRPPSPPCAEKLDDGTCCPLLASPPIDPRCAPHRPGNATNR